MTSTNDSDLEIYMLDFQSLSPVTFLPTAYICTFVVSGTNNVRNGAPENILEQYHDPAAKLHY